MLLIRMIKYIDSIMFKSHKRSYECQREFEKFGVDFWENSCAKGDHTIEYICKELRSYTHVIEKGLSLPNVKKGFGKEKVKSINNLLKEYEDKGDYDYDPQAYANAVAILQVYAEEADHYSLDLSGIDEKYLSMECATNGRVGAIKTSYLSENVKNLPFNEFAKSRHSYRDYIGRAPKELIEESIKLAMSAPSASNRQDVRLICVEGNNARRVLAIHPGAVGFGDTDQIVLLSVDLSMYGIYEMSLPYIDSGIFLMNLLYAFYYYGIGACPLIWEDYCNGDKLREIVDVPKGYLVSAIIPIGMIPESSKVASSLKRDINDILFYYYD